MNKSLLLAHVRITIGDLTLCRVLAADRLLIIGFLFVRVVDFTGSGTLSI